METIKELRDKQAKERDLFVKNCKHTKISDWVDFYSGFDDKAYLGQARICEICEILLELKDNEGRIIIDPSI